MLLADLVATSRDVAGASARLQKIAWLADLLARTPPEDLDIVISYLSGALRQGRIGVASAALRHARDVEPAGEPGLSLREVDETFERILATTGAGSAATRAAILRDLMRRATRDEQDFLVRLLFGELRQGALEGVLVEAVARAARLPAARIRRAAMLAGGLPDVARLALTEGAASLDRFAVQPFRPIQPMLAESAADVAAALVDLGEASVEYKLDGARIQVHKSDDEVRVFTRNLRDVTAAVPEVGDAVRRLPPRALILDGEALAVRTDGTPQPFQITMRRFGRKLDVDAMRETLPLAPFFFDCLYLDGAALIDEPLARRLGELDRVTPATLRVPRIVTASSEEASAFARRAVGAGHEGVMAKAIAGTYAAGRRGQAWVKVKQPRTLDLVVLAVEWGSGRRRGTLSNLHLGARDAERGGFVMLGKTFKGLTDEMLSWQTAKLLSLEIARDDFTVHVKPELVVEIAFNEIQESPQYPGGLALRFARVKRYRTDKTAADADTFASVQKIYEQITGLPAPRR